MIKRITLSEIKKVTDREGLVLQGCGGDLQEWVDGINAILTEEEILLNGDKFKNIAVFEHNGHTNMLFHFLGVRMDMSKFAIWRLRTREHFGSQWLSDYLTNNFGIELQETEQKPNCPIIGANGNIYNLMGLASHTLKDHGMFDAAEKMCGRIRECSNYSEALCVLMEYVTPVSKEDMENGFEMGGLE